MTNRPTDRDREQAAELLPWAPTDDDGLAYRQDRIAQALADARAEGRRETLDRLEVLIAGRVHLGPSSLDRLRTLIAEARS